MPHSKSAPQLLTQQIVRAQHLQQRMLNPLPLRTRPQQRLLPSHPFLIDRCAALHGLQVPMLSFGGEIQPISHSSSRFCEKRKLETFERRPAD